MEPRSRRSVTVEPSCTGEESAVVLGSSGAHRDAFISASVASILHKGALTRSPPWPPGWAISTLRMLPPQRAAMAVCSCLAAARAVASATTSSTAWAACATRAWARASFSCPSR